MVPIIATLLQLIEDSDHLFTSLPSLRNKVSVILLPGRAPC